MAMRRKQITKANKEKAITFFERALQLQRDMYDFREELEKMNRKDLA